MYRIIRSFLIALMATSCVAIACTDRENGPDNDALHFNFDIIPDSQITSRSQVTASEEIICSAELFLFDAEYGYLVQKIDFTSSSDYKSHAVQKGRKYTIYALANCRAEGEITKLSQMDTLSVKYGSMAEINSKGLPMAGVYNDFTFDDNNTSVNIPLSRLMSKVILNINTNSMNGDLNIKKVTLHNAPAGILPFCDSYRANPGTTLEGDSSTTNDINRLNNGKSIVLLVGENMQGTLLPGNTNPWEKIPENIPGKQDCCTYITVEGDYRDGGLSISDVCYNMYLGENSTTNFDICRNCIYDLTLTLSDEAIVLASSWKVERGTTLDTREISFERPVDTLARYSNSSIRIICSPSAFDYEVFAGEDFKEAGLTYSTNQDGTVTISSGNIQGKSATGRLFVRSWDRAKSGYCDVTVMKWDTIVKINHGQPLLMWKKDTLKFVVSAFLENKHAEENVTSMANVEFDGYVGKIISYPKSVDTLLFVGQVIGNGIINAECFGRSHSVRAVVSKTKSIFLMPRDTTIHIGDSVALRGHVVFESGDTLCYPQGFDYLVRSKGCFTKKTMNNMIYAQKSGKEHPFCILKRDASFSDSLSSLITVLP